MVRHRLPQRHLLQQSRAPQPVAGDQLRDLRRCAHLRQRDLGERLGQDRMGLGRGHRHLQLGQRRGVPQHRRVELRGHLGAGPEPPGQPGPDSGATTYTTTSSSRRRSPAISRRRTGGTCRWRGSATAFGRCSIRASTIAPSTIASGTTLPRTCRSASRGVRSTASWRISESARRDRHALHDHDRDEPGADRAVDAARARGALTGQQRLDVRQARQ